LVFAFPSIAAFIDVAVFNLIVILKCATSGAMHSLIHSQLQFEHDLGHKREYWSIGVARGAKGAMPARNF